MRTFNENFSEKNNAPAKAPHYVVEISFDDAHTDLHYLTSHDDTALPTGASATTGVLHGISGSFQRIKPVDGKSEIGALSFSATDYQSALTTLFNTKLGESKGLRNKRVRVYRGYDGLAWDDYELFGTQRIEGDVDFDQGAYHFKCMDIQRAMREKIFRVKKTNLAASVSATDTEIPAVVGTTDRFETVYHGPSYGDAPNATVGYIKIDDEIIRYTGINHTTGEFTGCTRGVLGTRAAEHALDSGAASDRQPLIEEVVYLELPAIKLAYALLSGSLYGDGASLPDHWHLGIAAEYINTAAFTGIGTDVWDPSDDSAGKVIRFVLFEDEDGKKFIEQEIMLLAGCFMPIGADGALGLKRMTGMLSSAAYVAVLDEDNSVSRSKLTHDMKGVHNALRILWNYRHDLEKPTRSHYLFDADSIATHGQSKLLTFEFRGLHGSRHTYNTLMQLFDAWRDRVSGPPLKHQRQLMPSMNSLETGDVVRVQDAGVRDYTGGGTIDRAMEIQQLKVDWKTGRVSVDLFGSSQKASPLTNPIEGDYGSVPSSSVLPDSLYSTKGTDLTTVSGLTISESGGVGTITAVDAGTVLSGVYHYIGGDLVLDVDVPVSGNFQLWVPGNISGEGKFDGAGRGHAGGTGNDGGGIGTSEGTPGYFGVTESGGSIGATAFGVTSNRYAFMLTEGQHTKTPPIAVEYDGSDVVNLPTDLRGTSGAGGAMASENDGTITGAAGGDGGAGGAGVLIVCRGFTPGVNGGVDTSGGDGQSGGTVEAYGNTYYAGSGAGGAPGAFVLLLDGAGAIYTTEASRADQGATPINGTPMSDTFVQVTGTGPYTSYYTGFGSRQLFDAAFHAAYIQGEQTAEEDVPEVTSDAASVTVTESTDTPHSPAGNLSGLEVSVSAPSDGNYSHSVIYYRIDGSGAPWQRAGVVDANGEYVITVASDGTTYEIMARSVSIAGVENPTGPTTTITTTNVETPTAGDTDVGAVIIPPPVTGLEVDGQGNDTEFGGADCKLRWNATTITGWIEFGNEPDGLGAGASSLDQYLAGYMVRVYDSAGTEIREEGPLPDPRYTYTHEKNAEDYRRENDAAGAYRAFTVEVASVTHQNQESDPVALEVSNPAPALPTSVSIDSAAVTIFLQTTAPDDLDLAGMMVWLSDTSGFTPGVLNLVHKGPGEDAVIDRRPNGAKLSAGTTYYVRFAFFDRFTDPNQKDATGLNLSSEYAVTMTGVEDGDIVSMVVDKLLSGSITSQTINVATDGVIRSGQTAYDTGTGFWLGDDSGTPKFSIGNSAGDKLTWSGSALTVTGDILIDANNYWKKSDNTFQVGDGTSNLTWDGSNLVVESLLSATGSGQRIEFNSGGNNRIAFYGDRGDGTIINTMTLGGSSGTISVRAGGQAPAAIFEVEQITDGGLTTSPSYIQKLDGNGTDSAHIRFVPSSSSSPPTSNSKAVGPYYREGDLFMDSSKRLWVCTAQGTDAFGETYTWEQLAFV